MKSLPKGWCKTKLGELLEFKYGKALPAKVRDGEGFPVYGSNGVVGYHSESLVKNGGLVVGRKGSFGEVHICNQDFSPIDTTYFVDEFPCGTKEYWYYQLKNLPLTKLNRATAIPGLNRDDAYAQDILLPPEQEQKRIVAKLDEVLAQVDTIKARLDSIPAILKSFRQSVLAAAVSGKLISSQVTERVNIGEISTDIRYGTSKKCDYDGGNIPVIRIPNIGDRKLDISDLKSADFTDSELEKLCLRKGDILVIRSNGSLDLVAKPALVEKQFEGFLFAGYLIRIRCDLDRILPSFLLNILCSRVVRDVVELGARSTSGVNNINSKELSSLEFELPSKEEQKEIVRLVDQYFIFADTIETQVKKAQARVDNLTQSILAKAFRGELVPQDPDDEPAEVLLERIAQARKEAEALTKAAKKAAKAPRKTAVKE